MATTLTDNDAKQAVLGFLVEALKATGDNNYRIDAFERKCHHASTTYSFTIVDLRQEEIEAAIALTECRDANTATE